MRYTAAGEFSRARRRPADLRHLPRPVRGRGRVHPYVVVAAHGLDASGYTFAYVAGWGGAELGPGPPAAVTSGG